MSADLEAIQLRQGLLPGDIGAVIRLHGAVYAHEHGWDHTFEGYVANGIGRFAESFDAASDRLWLAEQGGEIVGSIAILRSAPDTAQLRWFVVAPPARGHGLGRRMVAEALSFCRSRGYAAVMLQTARELRAAARLYHDFGFTLIEEGPCRARWGAFVTDQKYLLNL